MRPLLGVTLAASVLLLACGPSSEERADVGYDDGYAVGYNTECEIRATMIDGDFKHSSYSYAYQRGYADGAAACLSENPDVAKARAKRDLEGSSYVSQRSTDRCTSDCSGHEAGYAWAEENEIVDPDDCGGKSVSFIEGCQAYAEEVQARAEEIAAGGE
jgi:hypothetical protein